MLHTYTTEYKEVHYCVQHEEEREIKRRVMLESTTHSFLPQRSEVIERHEKRMGRVKRKGNWINIFIHIYLCI